MRNKNATVSNPNDFITCPGSKVHITYSPKVLDNGIIKLIQSGKENIQDKINSFREQCDISFILRRLEMGDTSVLNDKVPNYGDFTQVPKSYAEALQCVIDAEKKFYDLPLDTRNLFDNDYRQWFATAGSPDWIDKMGIKPAVDVTPDEKDKDVSE